VARGAFGFSSEILEITVLLSIQNEGASGREVEKNPRVAWVETITLYYSECLLTLKPYFFTNGYLLFFSLFVFLSSIQYMMRRIPGIRVLA
jgi:hypothetical protein